MQLLHPQLLSFFYKLLGTIFSFQIVQIFSFMRNIKDLTFLNYTSECIFGFYNQTFDLNFPVLLFNRVVEVPIDATKLGL